MVSPFGALAVERANCIGNGSDQLCCGWSRRDIRVIRSRVAVDQCSGGLAEVPIGVPAHGPVGVPAGRGERYLQAIISERNGSRSPG